MRAWWAAYADFVDPELLAEQTVAVRTARWRELLAGGRVADGGGRGRGPRRGLRVGRGRAARRPRARPGRAPGPLRRPARAGRRASGGRCWRRGRIGCARWATTGPCSASSSATSGPGPSTPPTGGARSSPGSCSTTAGRPRSATGGACERGARAARASCGVSAAGRAGRAAPWRARGARRSPGAGRPGARPSPSPPAWPRALGWPTRSVGAGAPGPHGRLDDRGARRRRLDHRLPQRRLLPPRRGGAARRRRPAPRPRDPHDALARARAPAPARARTCSPSTAPSGASASSTPRARRGARSTARSCSPAPSACSAPGSPTPTPTTRAGAGGSPSRRSRRRAAYRPRSPGGARLGPLTPPGRAPAEQTWHTYPPVRVPSADGVVAALLGPETWPDYATELGRFTAAAHGRAGRPDLRDRGRRRRRARAPGLHPRLRRRSRALVDRRRPARSCAPTSPRSSEGLRRFGRDEPRGVPDGGDAAARPSTSRPTRATSWAAARNRLLLFEQGGQRLRARRGDVGPDALAPRPGLPPRRPRRPARLLGPGRDRRRVHAPPDRARSAARRASATPDASSSAAGPNGLAAAITLAEAGRDVLVLEAADRLGGAVATEELTLPGFHHDVFSSVYPAAAASPVFARMAARAPRAALGPPGGRAGAPARRRARRRARARPRRDRRDARRPAPGDGAALARVRRRPTLRALRRAARDDAVRLPAAARAAPAARRAAGWAARSSSPGCCSCPRSARPTSSSRDGRSRAWLYGAAMHGDVPPHGAGSAIAGGVPRTSSATPSAGRARRAARSGWPRRSSGACATLGGEARTRRARHARRASSAAASPASRRRRRPASPRRSSSPTRRPRGAARARRRRARRRLRRRAAPLPPRARDAEGRLGARRADPVGGARGAPGRHGPRRRRRGRGPRGHVARVDAALPERPFLLLGQQCRRRPDARARRASTPRGPTRTARRASTGRREARPPRRRASRRRSSASRPASATGSWPGTSWPRRDLQDRNANLAGGDVGGGSYALDQTRLPPGPVAGALPHARPRACSWAARRRSRAAPCTASPATRPRALALAEARLRRF